MVQTLECVILQFQLLFLYCCSGKFSQFRLVKMVSGSLRVFFCSKHFKLNPSNGPSYLSQTFPIPARRSLIFCPACDEANADTLALSESWGRVTWRSLPLRDTARSCTLPTIHTIFFSKLLSAKVCTPWNNKSNIWCNVLRQVTTKKPPAMLKIK